MNTPDKIVPQNSHQTQQMETTSTAGPPSTTKETQSPQKKVVKVLFISKNTTADKASTSSQTSPSWDDLLSVSFQKQLIQKLEPQIACEDGRESMCVHRRFLTLDKILAIVVEHHNLLCVLNKRDETRVTRRKKYLEMIILRNHQQKLTVMLQNLQ